MESKEMPHYAKSVNICLSAVLLISLVHLFKMVSPFVFEKNGHVV
jgi:hypothetical protein